MLDDLFFKNRYVPQRMQLLFVFLSTFFIPCFIFIPCGVFLRRILIHHWEIGNAITVAISLVSSPSYFIVWFVLFILNLFFLSIIFHFVKPIHLFGFSILGNFYLVGRYYLTNYLLNLRSLSSPYHIKTPAKDALIQTIPVAFLLILGVYVVSVLLSKIWFEEK